MCLCFFIDSTQLSRRPEIDYGEGAKSQPNYHRNSADKRLNGHSGEKSERKDMEIEKFLQSEQWKCGCRGHGSRFRHGSPS